MDNRYREPSILDTQELLTPFQQLRQPYAPGPQQRSVFEPETPFLQTRAESEAPATAEVVRSWGSKATMAAHIERLTYAALPHLAGKKPAAMLPGERKAFNSIWVSIRQGLLAQRRQLVAAGFVPPLGGAAVPFGFRQTQYGAFSGLQSDTAYLSSPRLETVLAALQEQGKISVTQEQLDTFQRVANVETSGMVQTLNTYDSAVVSIGFFQFTIHVGKIQAWIKLAPGAFRRYGIELDDTARYNFGSNGLQPAIKGVPDSRRNELRWNGWAERFYYAGLDPEVIAAQVRLAADYLKIHERGLKARLKDNAIYEQFMNLYRQDAYIRGLFQASYNNNPSRSTRCVKEAVAAFAGSPAAFLEKYKEVLNAAGWSRLVKLTAKGATITLQQVQPEIAGEDYIAAVQPEMPVDDAFEGELWYGQEAAYNDEASLPLNGDDEMEYHATTGEEEGEAMDETTGIHDFEAEFDNETPEDEYDDMPPGGDNSEAYTETDAEEEGPSGYDNGEDYTDAPDAYEALPGYEPGAMAYESPAPPAGITRLLDVSAQAGKPYKTGAYLPPSFTPSARPDVVVYLHGLYSQGAQPDGIAHYWQHYANIRELFASANRNALLLAPTMGSDPQNRQLVFHARNGFDSFMQDCFNALAAGGQLPAGATPGRIILAGHSAGGHPLSGILASSNQLKASIAECWGLDCLYGYNYDAWLQQDRQKHRFYHYWAYTRANKKSTPGINGDALQSRHSNFFNIAPKQVVYHQGIIAYAWKNEINTRAWFGAASPPTAGTVTTDPARITIQVLAAVPFLTEEKAMEIAWNQGIKDKNQLTNLVFYKRYPSYAGRRLEKTDPQHLKDAWTSILRSVVTPFAQKQGKPPLPAPLPQAPVPATGAFRLTALPLHQTPITIVKPNAKAKLAEIKEAPAVYLKAIVRNAGYDPDKWFNSFTRINFLGRELGSGHYVHVEFAQLLQRVEADFARKTGIADMKALGDHLGLKDRTMAGSRATSSTATYSYHMFGLALDINYSGNPYIQPAAHNNFNKFMLKVGQLHTNGAIPLINWSRWNRLDMTTADYMQLYDELSALDKHLEKYFGYLDDAAALQARLAAATQGPWKGMRLADAQSQIQKDLEDLTRAWRGSRSNPQDIFRAGGFLELSKEFVKGMVEAGLDWGGRYGDMMHFDMRRTGAGAAIESAKNRYISQKNMEARQKFNTGKAAVSVT